jgi:crotonobetainyl-CoA:carnitine CoA-transferase CaiB-like acyl-CoA transferase
MADLGAEIIKVENPADGGDIGRSVGPYFFAEGDSHFHQSFNRNKRSITLDLKKPEGMAVLHDLVKDAAGVYDNLRGDLPEKFGLTYAALKQYNPAIVCSHLSAYGRSGSRANWPGYDYLMQAEAGYLSLTGEPDGPPARFGLSIIDMMTGVTAAMGMLAGIVGARQTGQGRDIDVSLFDVALHNLSYLSTWYLNDGVVTQRQPRSGHPSLTPSQLYKTKDGWLFVMCNKEKFWKLLVQALGRPEWADHPDYCNFKVRLANRERVTQMLDEALSVATTAEWLARLAGKIPVAPVYDVQQALDNPFVQEQQRVLEADHPQRGSIRTVACPVRCADEPDRVGIAPTLGADTADVLSGLGYDAGRIERLRKAGVI